MERWAGEDDSERTEPEGDAESSFASVDVASRCIWVASLAWRIKVSDDDAKTCCAGVLHEESTSTRFSCGLCGSRQWGFFALAHGALALVLLPLAKPICTCTPKVLRDEIAQCFKKDGKLRALNGG